MRTRFEIAKDAFVYELGQLRQALYCKAEMLHELVIQNVRGYRQKEEDDTRAQFENVKTWQKTIENCRTPEELIALCDKASIDCMEDEGAARVCTLCLYGGDFDRHNWND